MGKTKEENLEYFSKKYKSGISEQIALLHQDIIENNKNKNIYIDIIAIIKKDGFYHLTKMLVENGNKYSEDGFKKFLDNILLASVKYDKFKFRDYLRVEQKETIQNDFSEFIDKLIKLKQNFDIRDVLKLKENFNIKYKINQDYLNKEYNEKTYFYLKSNDSYSKGKSFFLNNLENNQEKLIDSFEKLSKKNKNTDIYLDNFFYLTYILHEKFEKIEKFDNIIETLQSLNSIIINKGNLLNEKLINIKIAYEELKEKNPKKDTLEQATILFKKSIQNIETNIETYNQEKNNFNISLKKYLNKKNNNIEIDNNISRD